MFLSFFSQHGFAEFLVLTIFYGWLGEFGVKSTKRVKNVLYLKSCIIRCNKRVDLCVKKPSS